MKNNMREPLWEGMARVFTRWLAARMLDSDTVTAVLGVYRDDYVEELTGFSSGDWQACRVKAVEVGAKTKSPTAAGRRYPCLTWTGAGGDCTTCGVAAYSHPGAPTPAGRGCKKFKGLGRAGIGVGDAERCDYCCLPLRDHTPEMRAP